MNKLIYSGKAKDIFATNNPNEVLIKFKDDATSGNGIKHEQIQNKGNINNEISYLIFKYLEKNGIKTHFIKKIDSNNQIVKKLDVIPLEVIVRNIAAGSFVKRYNKPKGLKFEKPIFEFSYKCDELNDPLMNKDHAIQLGIITEAEYTHLKTKAFEINNLLKDLFLKTNLTLVDFKLEFGKDLNGEIILADEFSPDNCRLWDVKTNESLDKDLFREGTGDIIPVYKDILRRLENEL